MIKILKKKQVPSYILAHKHSSNHKEQLVNDLKCGCFHCLQIFSPTEIDTWIEDILGTAVCPYCFIDSVIGESSGYLVTKVFLTQMNKYWFD